MERDRALLLGHSFIRRLKDHGRKNPWNFGSPGLNLNFLYWSGGKIPEMNVLINQNQFENYSVVFTQFGATDVCDCTRFVKHETDDKKLSEILDPIALKIAEDYWSTICLLRSKMNTKSVIVIGRLLKRWVQPEYCARKYVETEEHAQRLNITVEKVNQILGKKASQEPFIKFWRTKGIHLHYQDLLYDGTHLNDDGMARYQGQVTSALLTGAKIASKYMSDVSGFILYSANPNAFNVRELKLYTKVFQKVMKFEVYSQEKLIF